MSSLRAAARVMVRRCAASCTVRLLTPDANSRSSANPFDRDSKRSEWMASDEEDEVADRGLEAVVREEGRGMAGFFDGRVRDACRNQDKFVT